MGANRLSAIARQLEDMKNFDDGDTINSIFEDIKNESEIVAEFLSLPNWIEIAKQKESAPNEQLNAHIAC